MTVLSPATSIGRLAEFENVDVLLTHGAPTGLLYYGYDPGCEYVNDLIGTVQPDLCLLDHHHRHEEADIEGCRFVSLESVWERYYTLDPVESALDIHVGPNR